MATRYRFESKEGVSPLLAIMATRLSDAGLVKTMRLCGDFRTRHLQATFGRALTHKQPHFHPPLLIAGEDVDHGRHQVSRPRVSAIGANAGCVIPNYQLIRIPALPL